MSATCGDEKIWKWGISFNRCLCVIWIIVTLGWRESQQSSVIIVQDSSCDPCYRKLLAGKRLSESHVRRNVRCDRIEDCHRNCEYESTFVCEGFNYGRMQQGPSHVGANGNERVREYMCQLTSVSGSRMDPRRDFVDDKRWDYYERDWNCPAEKSAHGVQFGGDWPVRELSARLPTKDRSNWQSPGSSPSAWPARPYEGSLIPSNVPYPSRRYVPATNRPINYDRYPMIDHQPRVSYLPQRQSYNDIFPPSYSDILRQSAALPDPGSSSQANQQYSPYYYGTRYDPRVDNFPRRRQDEQRIWRFQSSGPNDLTTVGPPLIYDYPYGYGTNSGYPGSDSIARDQTRKIIQNDERVLHYGYNYGPAYGYNSKQGSSDASSETGWIDLNKPEAKPDSSSADCSVRSLAGFKISRRIIVASHVTGNLEECEMLCTARKDCRSFAYRYSLVATAPTDNCLLSNVQFDRLDFYTDLEPERDYDVYAIVGDPGRCQGEAKKPRPSDVRMREGSSEECFWRVRSGCQMPASLTREKIRVDNGLGECQLACVESRRFTCRSFVFRYDYEADRDANCFLSDCPTSEIIELAFSNLDKSIVDRQAELYERGSYGRGCEAYPFSTIRSTANIGKKIPTNGQGCYSGYHSGCRLSPYAVSSVSRADSENECRRQCSRMRQSQHSSPCMSFSFKHGDEKRGDNCYLSDVPRRDLRLGLDYTYDDDYVMYAWKELEPQCTFAYENDYHDSSSYDGRFNYATTGNNDYHSQFLPASYDSSMSIGNSGFTGNNFYLAVRPLEQERPPAQSTPNYQQTSNDEYFSPTYIDDFASFNRHYTVNGYPCKRGTKCEINKIVGFWSCEPEGSEFGTWDYCCEPNHHCGFSSGYDYPWCYVGSSEDQWRPCSDKYYPYLPSPRPTIANNNKPSSSNDYRRKNDVKFYRNYENEDSTLTKQGRHWPIAYLHPLSPPNSTTTDSVALANQLRDSSRLGEKTRNEDNERSTNTNKIKNNHDQKFNDSMEMYKTRNSSIERIQRTSRKSHLKRRGLISSNTTNANDQRTRDFYKKYPRIFIVPADDNVKKIIPGNYSGEFRDNENGRGKKTSVVEERTKDGGAGIVEAEKRENFNVSRERKKSLNVGRVERVNGGKIDKNNEYLKIREVTEKILRGNLTNIENIVKRRSNLTRVER